MKTKLKAFLKEKWNIVLFFIFVVLVTGMIFQIQMTNMDQKVLFSEGESVDISTGWTYEYGDGISGTIDLPGKLPKSSSRYLTLTHTLPEVSDNMYLIYRARHSFVRITIDGQVLLDRITAEEEKNDWYTLEGTHYVEVKLESSYSGKEVVIEEYTSEARYLCKPGDIYLGERGSFILSRVQTKLPALICFFILLIATVIIFVLWGVGIFMMKKNLRELLSLGFFTLGVALWLFTETDFLQLLGYGTRFAVVLAVEVLILLPVPIALFFYYASERKRGKVLSRILAIIPLVWFVIANLLHIFKLVSFSNTLIVTQILLGVELVAIGYVQISEIRYMHHSDKYGAKISLLPLFGIIAMIPLGLIEIGTYMLSPGSHYGDGKYITAGIVIYIFTLCLDSVLRTTYRQAQAENASSMKTQFLANMSHEIRTPLNAILGFNEAIIQDPADENQVKGYALNIREAGENLKDIINSILDISKIEMGQLQIDSKEYSSMELLDNLSSMFELLAHRKELEFYTEISPDIPSTLIGDESHLRQILTNILSNAVKYTDRGSVTLKAEVIDMPQDSPMCKLRFSVKDTGRGIKEEDRQKLFEKFTRLDTEHFKHVEGSGLGMSIVQLTLKAMGSAIKFDSVYGEGTTFYFDIDQVAINKDGIGDFNKRRAESALKENQSIRFRAPKAEVLIVDDVKMNIDATKALLGFTQMKIDHALSGQEAIDKVQQKHYDIIFMDHMMPGMDGIEATEKIRNLSVEKNEAYYAMVPVIALTANAIVGVRTLYQQAGMQDYVSKPIQVPAMVNALKKWLAKDLIEEATEEEFADTDGFSEATEEDWNLGIAGLSGDEAKKYNVNVEGLKANLQSYAEMYEANSGEISSYFASNAIKDYITKVHGLKSTSKIIGAMDLHHMAKTIEAKGNEQGVMEEKDFKQLMDMYKTLVGNIRAYFPAVQSDSPVISEDDYNALLVRIKDAGDNFDSEEFMNLDEELKNINVPDAHKEEFEKLKLHVSMLQYTEAAELIANR